MRRMLPFPRSVRARLTLWNVLVLALVLFILGGVLQTIVARNLQASMDADLKTRSLRHTWFWANREEASHLPPASFATQSKGQSPKGPPPEPAGPKTRWRTPVAERVFDLKGVQSFPKYRGEPPWDRDAFDLAVRGRETFTNVNDENIAIRVYSVPLRRKSGEMAGVAQLASSMEEMEQAIGNLNRALLTLVPLGLVAAWTGGMFLTGRMLRPVREVTRTAGQLGAQDLSQRLVVSGQDEFSELAATFNGMLGRLETYFEQQRRFTADASHELRTPLTVIKSVASRFLSRKELPEDYRRGMERLDKAAGVMERVVQDMLLLARSDTGQLELQRSPVRLCAVIDEALACVPLENSPTVRNEAADSSLIVVGDASHLTRLFSNLLNNAVRHTSADGSITVSVQQQRDQVIVTVSDTGVGISEEHLPHLTERFYRIDTARARIHGGAGLGLAICQSIVEAHGGTLKIESALGKGTSVTVTLPLVSSVA